MAQTSLGEYERDSMSNIGPSIIAKLNRRLFAQPNHPLSIVKTHIHAYFQPLSFALFDHFDPVVSVKQNFDDLCFPPDHPGRRPSDSYFINNHTLLRTHMTANEGEFLRAGHRSFLIAGDVYRRDQIDATHYPVFHQLEGVRVFRDDEIHESNKEGESPFTQHAIKYDHESQPAFNQAALRTVTDSLYHTLNGLMRHLFGPDVPIRWQTCYFPFTCPSFEIEVFYRGRWVEVCGSGVLQQSILQENGLRERNAWAFGLGLERLAMILFDIPDIRLFWSEDERFLSQFRAGQINTRFQPFSKYPACWRDLSFWIGDGAEFDEMGLYDLIREHGQDLVEDVQLVSESHECLCFYYL